MPLLVYTALGQGLEGRRGCFPGLSERERARPELHSSKIYRELPCVVKALVLRDQLCRMPANQIQYSEKYYDDVYEYRHATTSLYACSWLPFHSNCKLSLYGATCARAATHHALIFLPWGHNGQMLRRLKPAICASQARGVATGHCQASPQGGAPVRGGAKINLN